jgi:hypothetical protein
MKHSETLSDTRIPVTLLTGFLGAGKISTTESNRWRPQPTLANLNFHTGLRTDRAEERHEHKSICQAGMLFVPAFGGRKLPCGDYLQQSLR